MQHGSLFTHKKTVSNLSRRHSLYGNYILTRRRDSSYATVELSRVGVGGVNTIRN